MRKKITKTLIFIHEYGVTPYSYHTDNEGNRHQHYFATAVATFVLASFLEVITMRCGRPHFPRFEDFDGTARQVVAGMSYLAIVATVGVIAGILHFGINRLRSVKNRSNYSVQVPSVQIPSVQVSDDEIELPELTPPNERTGLLGKDREGASIYRLENCHPIHAVYPATPIKTMIWISTLMLSISVIVGLAKPDLVNEFIGNGTAPDCPILKPGDCIPLSNFFIKCGALIGIAFPVIFSGVVTFSQCVGSGVMAHYQHRQHHEPVLAPTDDKGLTTDFVF